MELQEVHTIIVLTLTLVSSLGITTFIRCSRHCKAEEKNSQHYKLYRLTYRQTTLDSTSKHRHLATVHVQQYVHELKRSSPGQMSLASGCFMTIRFLMCVALMSSLYT